MSTLYGQISASSSLILFLWACNIKCIFILQHNMHEVQVSISSQESVYVCQKCRFCLFLRLFYWNLKLFRQCGIILFFMLFVQNQHYKYDNVCVAKHKYIILEVQNQYSVICIRQEKFEDTKEVIRKRKSNKESGKQKL